MCLLYGMITICNTFMQKKLTQTGHCLIVKITDFKSKIFIQLKFTSYKHYPKVVNFVFFKKISRILLVKTFTLKKKEKNNSYTQACQLQRKKKLRL